MDEPDPSAATDAPPPAPPTPDGSALIVPELQQDPPRPFDGQIWIKVPENIVKIRVGGPRRGRTMVLYAAVSSLVNPWLELGSYIDFVLFMTLGVVVGFQLPVVMLIAAMSRLVDVRWLTRYRRHCLFICAALGAALTPADPVSMVVLAVPLYALFEFGLLLMRVVVRRQEAEDAREAGGTP